MFQVFLNVMNLFNFEWITQDQQIVTGVKGRKFRQPAYLATSFSHAVAKDFISRAASTSKVLWRVRLPSHHS